MRTTKVLSTLLLSLILTGCMTYLATQDDGAHDRRHGAGITGSQRESGRQGLNIADAIVTDIAIISLLAKPLLDQYKKATVQSSPPINTPHTCQKSQNKICSSSTGCWCTEID